MSQRGNVYIEVLVVLPLFLILFLGIRYMGAGFYVTARMWAIVADCVRYEKCDWKGKMEEAEVSSVSSFVNEIAGTRGKEISYVHAGDVVNKDIRISAVNYQTLNTWTSATKEGWIFGGGLVLLGFIKGFAGSGEVKALGSEIIPDFSEEKIRRFYSEIENRS